MQRAYDWSITDLPQVACPDLTTHLDQLLGKTVSVVFASYYLGNPASAFGHVILSLADSAGAALDGYSVSFEADTDGLSALDYIRRGLFGGLSAAYRISPMHVRAARYERGELRDLWLFPLGFTGDQSSQLVRHLWEVQGLDYGYGFLGGNCAQRVLAAIHAIAPEYGLLPYSPRAVLPSEVVRRLVHRIGVAAAPLRRPSLREHHESLVKRLSPAERSQFERMTSRRIVVHDAPAPALAAALTWSELNTPGRAFRREAETIEHPDATWRRGIWAALIAAGDSARPGAIPEPVLSGRSILAGHRPMAVAIASGYRSNEGAALNVRMRWLLHDVLDVAAGYPPQSSLVAGQVEVHVDATGRFSLEELTVLRVEQLGPMVDRRVGVAWRLDAGARRIPGTAEGPLHIGVEAGFGAGIGVTQPNASVLAYAMVGVRPGVARFHGRADFGAEALLTVGAVLQMPGQVRAQAKFEHARSSVPEQNRTSIGIVARRQLARDWELEGALKHTIAYRELRGGIIAFF